MSTPEHDENDEPETTDPSTDEGQEAAEELSLRWARERAEEIARESDADGLDGADGRSRRGSAGVITEL